MGEAMVEPEGVSEEGNGDVAAGLEEAADIQLEAAVDADHVALDGVHQTMEQGAVAEVVERLNLEEADDVQVVQIGSKVEAAGSQFGNHRRVDDRFTPAGDDARLLRNRGRKKGLQDNGLFLGKR